MHRCQPLIYKARSLTARSLGELKDKAIARIDDGSLDSGMGFARLIGALLYITERQVITLCGKEFTHESHWGHQFVGDLTEKQEDALLNVE